MAAVEDDASALPVTNASDQAVQEPPEERSRESKRSDDEDDAKVNIRSPHKMKTDSSYYHFASTPAEQAMHYKPKRVDSSKAVSSGPTAGSAWNTGATMEEFDYSSWMQDRLKELLVTVEFSNPDLRIDSVEKCDGSATLLFVRGKLRPGCDMSLKCKWKGTMDDEEVEGSIHVDDITLDDDPDEWEFRVTSKKSARPFKRARQIVSRDKERILEIVARVCDELRAKRQ